MRDHPTRSDRGRVVPPPFDPAPDAPPDHPIHGHREAVQPDWVDYNGHLNVAFYVLIFDHATDVMLDRLGLGAAYVAAERGMLFVVESHICYERELVLGQEVTVSTQLLGRDAKRLHAIHQMWAEPPGGGPPFRAATLEILALHIDHASRRVAPFPPDRAAAIDALWQGHGRLPRPDRAGRAIAGPARIGRPDGAGRRP